VVAIGSKSPHGEGMINVFCSDAKRIDDRINEKMFSKTVCI
jgi:hypothetical protein